MISSPRLLRLLIAFACLLVAGWWLHQRTTSTSPDGPPVPPNPSPRTTPRSQLGPTSLVQIRIVESTGLRLHTYLFDQRDTPEVTVYERLLPADAQPRPDDPWGEQILTAALDEQVLALIVAHLERLEQKAVNADNPQPSGATLRLSNWASSGETIELQDVGLSEYPEVAYEAASRRILAEDPWAAPMSLAELRTLLHWVQDINDGIDPVSSEPITLAEYLDPYTIAQRHALAAVGLAEILRDATLEEVLRAPTPILWRIPFNRRPRASQEPTRTIAQASFVDKPMAFSADDLAALDTLLRSSITINPEHLRHLPIHPDAPRHWCPFMNDYCLVWKQSGRPVARCIVSFGCGGGLRWVWDDQVTPRHLSENDHLTLSQRLGAIGSPRFQYLINQANEAAEAPAPPKLLPVGTAEPSR